jgi:hypothetical protein
LFDTIDRKAALHVQAEVLVAVTPAVSVIFGVD